MTHTIPVDPATLLARVYMALLFAPSRLANIAGLSRLSGSLGTQSLPLQDVSPAIALGVELLLGILLLLGFKNRWGELGLAVLAAVVMLSVHALLNMPGRQRMPLRQSPAGNTDQTACAVRARADGKMSNCPTPTAGECFGLLPSGARCWAQFS